MAEQINTHHLICDFGKHKGTAWTRVPVAYLLWIANQAASWNGGEKTLAIAQAELKRRGTVKPTIEISGHAIDRASQQLIGKWMSSRTHDEGLHAWLCRMAVKAREVGKHKGEKFHFDGIKFVFEEGSDYPILKTVMPEGNGK